MSTEFRKTELGKAFYKFVNKFVNLHFAAVQVDSSEYASHTKMRKAWAESDAAQKELVEMLTIIAEQEKYV